LGGGLPNAELMMMMKAKISFIKKFDQKCNFFFFFFFVWVSFQGRSACRHVSISATFSFLGEIENILVPFWKNPFFLFSNELHN
jgi:hypothetical protein